MYDVLVSKEVREKVAAGIDANTATDVQLLESRAEDMWGPRWVAGSGQGEWGYIELANSKGESGALVVTNRSQNQHFTVVNGQPVEIIIVDGEFGGFKNKKDLLKTLIGSSENEVGTDSELSTKQIILLMGAVALSLAALAHLVEKAGQSINHYNVPTGQISRQPASSPDKSPRSIDITEP
jgi:hypothetical protein